MNAATFYSVDIMLYSKIEKMCHEEWERRAAEKEKHRNRYICRFFHGRKESIDDKEENFESDSMSPLCGSAV